MMKAGVIFLQLRERWKRYLKIKNNINITKFKIVYDKIIPVFLYFGVPFQIDLPLLKKSTVYHFRFNKTNILVTKESNIILTYIFRAFLYEKATQRFKFQ